MKRVGLLFTFALLAVVSSFAQSGGGVNVQDTFNYNFTSYVLCSSTVTTNCLDHFEEWDYTNPASPVVLATAAIPTGASGQDNGIVTTYTWAGIGQRTVAQVMVGKDQSGNPQHSDPSKCNTTVLLQPVAPTGLAVKLP